MKVTKRQAIPTTALVLFVATICTVLTVKILSRSDHRASDSSTSIGAPGGQLTFGNVTITVPPGAVRRKTRLSISSPQATALQPPLANITAAPTVAFDVSLGDHQQPLKPLALQVKLQGNYLPQGANPQQTLLYTPSAAGYELVQSEVSPAGVLSAQLSHLSPKVLAWPDPRKLMAKALNQLFPNGIFQPRPTPDKCVSQASHGGITVHFDDQQSNWSTGRFSPVHPCLEFDQGNVALKINNNSNLMWPVTTSAGAHVESTTTDIDTTSIKFLASLIGLPDGTRAILGRGDLLKVTVDPSDLPLTVHLHDTPATAQAEALLGTFYMLIDLLGFADNRKLLKALMDSKSVTECIQAHMRLKEDNLASGLGDTWTVVTGICGQTIGGVVTKYGGDTPAAKWLMKKGLALAGDIKTLASSAVAQFEGVPRLYANPVSISVSQVMPCPSGGELSSLVRRLDANGPSDAKLGANGRGPNVYNVNGGIKTMSVSRSTCVGPWLVGSINATFKQPGSIPADDLLVLHRVTDHWELYANGGTDYSGTYPCQSPVPASIRQFLLCQ